MTASSIADVSDTAFWVAHYRGVEGQRSDPLFSDPLAARLAGEHGQQIAREMPGAAMTGWAVAIRTRLIDDYIRHAIAEGVDTVLNLGAGLDTRPYRMDLPASLQWIEADFPKVIDFKSERLASDTPRCRLSRVKIDLSDAAQRRQVLADVDASAGKLLILTEGVVPYLETEAVGALADELLGLKSARYWIVDYFSPAVHRMRRRTRRRMANAPFKFHPADWFGFFAEHGWKCAEMRYLWDEAKRLGRPLRIPPIYRLMLGMRWLFTGKERRLALQRFAGYALLERST
jgi:methyltransferase (TIGR00027 family)